MAGAGDWTLERMNLGTERAMIMQQLVTEKLSDQRRSELETRRDAIDARRAELQKLIDAELS